MSRALQVLLKIKAFMLRTHHSLACVGVTAMERLISRTGPQMSTETWVQAMASLVEVVQATKPDLTKLVSFPKERYCRDTLAPDGKLDASSGINCLSEVYAARWDADNSH